MWPLSRVSFVALWLDSYQGHLSNSSCALQPYISVPFSLQTCAFLWTISNNNFTGIATEPLVLYLMLSIISLRLTSPSPTTRCVFRLLITSCTDPFLQLIPIKIHAIYTSCSRKFLVKVFLKYLCECTLYMMSTLKWQESIHLSISRPILDVFTNTRQNIWMPFFSFKLLSFRGFDLSTFKSNCLCDKSWNQLLNPPSISESLGSKCFIT